MEGTGVEGTGVEGTNVERRGADRGGVERGDVEMGGEFCTSQKTVSDKWPTVFIDIDTIEIRSDEDPENSSITSRRSYNYKASH